MNIDHSGRSTRAPFGSRFGSLPKGRRAKRDIERASERDKWGFTVRGRKRLGDARGLEES